MAYKMKGSSFYKKNGKSPVKQKDFLDVQQQQNTIESGDIDNEEKRQKAAVRQSKRAHKNRSRIIGGPGKAII